MSELSIQQLEVAQLIVDTLGLDETGPDAIELDAPLFNEGLGLDSIDALELAVTISRTYGFQIKSSDMDNVKIFSSLRSLAEHIEKNQKLASQEAVLE
ncbi:MAG TPA: acyl carrier protein [Gammaproteobacteria bacterium]|nr:acyl carrier protein [Gammaproteobacteria bacterium]